MSVGTQSASAGAIETALVEIDELPAALHAEWEALAERCEASPFLHPGFVDLWGAVFRPGPLVLATARRDGELVAALPLVREPRRLAAAANWHSVETGLVAHDVAAAAALLAELLAQRPSSVALPLVDDRTGARLREAAARAGYRTAQETMVSSPYLDLDGDWETFQAALPSKRRSELRRLRRRLSEQGELSSEIVAGAAEGAPALAELAAIEAQGWKGEQGTAIRAQEQTSRFYRELLHWAAEQGWLRMHLLKLDGTTIAGSLGVRAHGVHYGLKMGFDREWGRYGPGVLLIEDVVRDAFEAGLRRVELLGDDDEYKRTWRSGVRERIAVHAFAPTVAGRLDRLAFVKGRQLARRLGIEQIARRGYLGRRMPVGRLQ